MRGFEPEPPPTKRRNSATSGARQAATRPEGRWRGPPKPRPVESHPLRHPALLEVRSGRSGTSRLRRVSSEAPKRRVFGCREERRWEGLTAEDEGIRTGAAADESNR